MPPGETVAFVELTAGGAVVSHYQKVKGVILRLLLSTVSVLLLSLR